MDILVGSLSLSPLLEAWHANSKLLLFSYFLALYLFVFLPIRWVYRYYFDPLSKIPGPKLELISGYAHRVYWYAFGRRGYLTFRIEEWHKKYGPIVRVSPYEVHINDIDSYNQIFKVGTKFPKNALFYSHPATVGSVLPIRDFHQAHLRRSALQPYFSKQAVRALEGVVQGKVSRFLERISEMNVINLSHGFRCLACDIITNYSYEKSFDALEHPDFAPNFLLAFEELTNTIGKQMISPDIFYFVNYLCQDVLNREVLRKISPMLAEAMDFTDRCSEAVMRQKHRWDAGDKNMTTIFKEMFQDDPKKGRRAATKQELTSEAVLTVGAGMDTTGHTLVMGTYYLIKHPEIQQKLLDELKTVMPHPRSDVKEDILEKLPYFQACLKEALRFGHGVPGAIARDVPSTGATILGHNLPDGTVTLNSHYMYHTNPDVFPEPFRFYPDRWLVDDTKEMEKYFMPFSRGARICIGMNLAWAELNLGLARLIRRYELTYASEFKHSNMIWIDTYVPTANGPLLVTAKERAD